MREILLNICLTAIALCLFKMLIPENVMKKQANFLIACFFFASLMFFFTSGRINFAYGADFGGETIPYINFDEGYTEAKREAIATEMRARLNAVLVKENIYPMEIFTIVSISDNISDKYSISINEIRLVFRSKGDEEDDEEIEILKKAVQIVQKEVGKDITITGEFKR